MRQILGILSVILLVTTWGSIAPAAEDIEADEPSEGKEDSYGTGPVRRTVIKGSGPEVFLVIGEQRRFIPNMRTLGLLGINWKEVRIVSDDQLNRIPRGTDYPSLSGSPVKGSGPEVYVLENGKRRRIYDEKTFEAMKLRWADIQTLPNRDLRLIPSGKPISK